MARRRIGIALGVVTLLALGALGLRWYAPEHRPGLDEGEAYALDVSHHQGRIDWARVADDDIAAAYIKATEGADWVDTRFEENWRGAAEHGLRRGAYHFFTLCRSGADQAANFLAVAPPVPGALPPAIDLEYGGNCAARPEPEVLLAEIDEFVQTVEAAWGQTMVVYLLAEIEADYGLAEHLERPMWRRSIMFRPDEDEWAIWQLSSFASVRGVDGRVDLNVIRLEHPAFGS